MTHAAPRHLRTLFALAVAALLAACQSMPAPKGFNAAQIAVLKEEGFIPAPAAGGDKDIKAGRARSAPGPTEENAS